MDSLRRDFESWYAADAMPAESDWFRLAPDGGYFYADTREAWKVWQAAARREREACAKVCEARIASLQRMREVTKADGSPYYDHFVLNGDIGCLTDIAAAIRSRSEQGKD